MSKPVGIWNSALPSFKSLQLDAVLEAAPRGSETQPAYFAAGKGQAEVPRWGGVGGANIWRGGGELAGENIRIEVSEGGPAGR